MQCRLYPDTTHGHIQGDGTATAGADQADMSKRMKILTEINFSNTGVVLVSTGNGTHGK